MCGGPAPLTIMLQWFPRVGIHSADVDQTASLMVDPHFGVIDDAGYHPAFTGFSRVCVDTYTSASARQTQ